MTEPSGVTSVTRPRMNGLDAGWRRCAAYPVQTPPCSSSVT
ncbi:MAG TPA: hypothetical protein VM290_06495 [Gaiellaceae bacterium]|nr:hypothetical protein [Gaiellaceae bacterium]